MTNSVDTIIKNEVSSSHEKDNVAKEATKSGLYYLSKVLVYIGFFLCFLSLVFISMAFHESEYLIHMIYSLVGAGSSLFYGFVGQSIDQIRINTEK